MTSQAGCLKGDDGSQYDYDNGFNVDGNCDGNNDCEDDNDDGDDNHFNADLFYLFISKNLVKGHFKSASNMTKTKRKTITKDKRKPRRAKKKQQK